MDHPLRIGIKHSGQDCTTDELRSVWRVTDDAGFDHLWAFDHLASIWIGAGGERMLRLTARHADVWNPSGRVGAELESAVRCSERLDESCAEIGRDPSSIRRSAQLWWDGSADGLVERVAPWVEGGF